MHEPTDLDSAIDFLFLSRHGWVRLRLLHGRGSYCANVFQPAVGSDALYRPASPDEQPWIRLRLELPSRRPPMRCQLRRAQTATASVAWASFRQAYHEPPPLGLPRRSRSLRFNLAAVLAPPQLRRFGIQCLAMSTEACKIQCFPHKRTKIISGSPQRHCCSCSNTQGDNNIEVLLSLWQNKYQHNTTLDQRSTSTSNNKRDQYYHC